MTEIYSQMETFFRNFFNTGVPGLSHNVEFSENEVEQILRQEFLVKMKHGTQLNKNGNYGIYPANW